MTQPRAAPAADNPVTGDPAIDKPEEWQSRAGYSAERVGFFTDAVFAIAMTLLAIDIPRPEGQAFGVSSDVSEAKAAARLWHFLAAQHDAYYAYLVAFSTLWIVWRHHHALFDQVRRVSPAMIGLHFPLLLLAAFVPYATIGVGRYPSNPLAALLFGLVVGALLVCRSALQSRADRDFVLAPTVDIRRYRAEVVVSWLVTGYWMATLLLVPWTPWVEISWFLAPAVCAVARSACRRP
ncbi:MAG TPA: TMEM175 family protein [Streptosporangiaceae bacterium]|nr:TMEM175 family protein [Streptosporangiaceae bacterium]